MTEKQTNPKVAPKEGSTGTKPDYFKDSVVGVLPVFGMRLTHVLNNVRCGQIDPSETV